MTEDKLVAKYWEIEKTCGDKSETSVFRTDGALYTGLRALQCVIIRKIGEMYGISKSDDVVAKLRYNRKFKNV